MTDTLTTLEDWAAPLLRQLQPDARNKLARNLAQQLRRSQQKRIASQRNPDGAPFVPRKQRDLRSKQGRIRRKVAMFQKLRTARYLKAKGDGDAISIEFTGRIARIARVHQYGLRDRAEAGAKDVVYARREVLGLTEKELDIVKEGVLAYLGV